MKKKLLNNYHKLERKKGKKEGLGNEWRIEGRNMHKRKENCKTPVTSLAYLRCSNKEIRRTIKQKEGNKEWIEGKSRTEIKEEGNGKDNKPNTTCPVSKN